MGGKGLRPFLSHGNSQKSVKITYSMWGTCYLGRENIIQIDAYLLTIRFRTFFVSWESSKMISNDLLNVGDLLFGRRKYYSD
jgi:hypothetical protein